MLIARLMFLSPKSLLMKLLQAILLIFRPAVPEERGPISGHRAFNYRGTT
jgi:hypothetical protein